MRLSELLNLPEFTSRNIVVIGTYKATEGKEYAVLAHHGEKLFPIPKLFHLVEITSENRDPEMHPAERRTILGRFKYFEAISKLP